MNEETSQVLSGGLLLGQEGPVIRISEPVVTF